MKNSLNYIVKSGIIAAVYAVITIVLAPLSFGGIQIRISEALTILPFFTNAAIPGLFIGCLIANFFGSPLGLLDVVLGSTATLLAAIITSKIKNKKFAPLPSIIVNAIVVPYVLWKVFNLPYLLYVLLVGIGQGIAVYGLGYPLLNYIQRNKKLREIIKD